MKPKTSVNNLLFLGKMFHIFIINLQNSSIFDQLD